MQSFHGALSSRVPRDVDVTRVLERNAACSDKPIESAENVAVHTMPERNTGTERSSCGGIQAEIAVPQVSAGTLGRKSSACARGDASIATTARAAATTWGAAWRATFLFVTTTNGTDADEPIGLRRGCAPCIVLALSRICPLFALRS